MARGSCDMNHSDRCQVRSYGSTGGKQERSLCNHADQRICGACWAQCASAAIAAPGHRAVKGSDARRASCIEDINGTCAVVKISAFSAGRRAQRASAAVAASGRRADAGPDAGQASCKEELKSQGRGSTSCDPAACAGR